MEKESKHKLHELPFSSSRLESLTDGIFAFAMTLLVLNLNAPELYGVVTNEELVTKLMAMLPRFLIFLLSFFLLASAWGVHHRQFSYITRSNGTLMWLNMMRLLFVIIVPFSSVLVVNYPDLSAAAFFFSANITLLCFSSLIEFRYAVSQNFTPDLPDEHKRVGNIKNTVPVLVGLAACVLSFVNPSVALWTFAVIPVTFLILKKAGKIV